jgi:carboxyl-terminal processing protease
MIARVMDFIQNSYVDEIDTQTLVDGAMRGLFESVGDPYSTYLSASDMEALGIPPMVNLEVSGYT